MSDLQVKTAAAPMQDAERQACLTLATVLAADRRWEPLVWMLVLCLTGLIWLTAAGLAPRTAGVMGWLPAALVMVLVERYLALRIAIDAQLFALLAQDGPLTLAGLDAALLAARWINRRQPVRSLSQRMGGAARLMRLHGIALAAGLAAVCGIIVAVSI